MPFVFLSNEAFLFLPGVGELEVARVSVQKASPPTNQRVYQRPLLGFKDAKKTHWIWFIFTWGRSWELMLVMKFLGFSGAFALWQMVASWKQTLDNPLLSFC